MQHAAAHQQAVLHHGVVVDGISPFTFWDGSQYMECHIEPECVILIIGFNVMDYICVHE